MNRIIFGRKPAFLFGLLVFLGLGLVAASSQAEAPTAVPLFVPAAAVDGLLDVATPVMRSRAVTVRPEALLDAQGQATEAVRLNLFAGVAVTAVLDEAGHNADGSLSWRGHVPGETSSRVNLVLKDGALVGAVLISQGYFEVQVAADDVHGIYRVNQGGYPDELPPAEVSFTAAQLAAAAQRPQTDPEDVIDIMVVYTPNATAGAGGVTAIENTITLAVDWTNTAYQDSLIVPRLNLVHMAQVTYNDSGSLGTDLGRLRIQNDGFMDEVHGWRNTYGADIVTLIVESPGCGIAYIMDTVSPAFEEYAFNVTMRTCAVGNYTFGHEIGHLQSARHDWFVDPTNNSPFTFNHGYVHPGNQWRTILAYSNDCGGCTRLGYFSNPDVLYNGDPMGVPVGQALAADNRLTLNTTALTVANFRQHVSGGTPTPTFTPSAPTSTATTSPVPSSTPTPLPTLTPTTGPSPSSTATTPPTSTATSGPSATPSATVAATSTASATATGSATRMATPTVAPPEFSLNIPFVLKQP